jgi:hypothetical protein
VVPVLLKAEWPSFEIGFIKKKFLWRSVLSLFRFFGHSKEMNIKRSYFHLLLSFFASPKKEIENARPIFSF